MAHTCSGGFPIEARKHCRECGASSGNQCRRPERLATSPYLNSPTPAGREIERLRKALSAACGYLLNAKIDLETGAPKRTAITTIEGGIRMVRAALNGEEG